LKTVKMCEFVNSDELSIYEFIAKAQNDPSIAKTFSYDTEQTALKVKAEALKDLYESPFYSKGGNPAAEWRLRVKRQQAIDNELSNLGSLALLCAGGLLTISRKGIVHKVSRFTHWKETMFESPLYQYLSADAKLGMVKIEFEDYNRLELGIQSFGQMICLSVSNLEDVELIEAFSQLKLWCVTKAVSQKGKKACVANTDKVLEYLKWLAKACQSVFLKSEIPEEPEDHPARLKGQVCPLVGELKFASDLIISGIRRKLPLSQKQARSLAQIANTNRALPYPSTEQSRSAITRTVETFTSSMTPTKESIKSYRLGLNVQKNRLDKPSSSRTHMSLVNKGTVESSRSQGGRSAFLVAHTRLATNAPLKKEHENLRNRFDQYGNNLIDPVSWQLAMVLIQKKDYKRKPTLGDILFIKPEELEEQWDYSLNGDHPVPKKLAELLNLTAAKLILEIGEYDFPHSIDHGLINFSTRVVKFNLHSPIKVKADLSIEAGMKTRLITSGLAAFVHLSQAPSNFMRSYLSSDPFCRVGFEESEKLWEVLKQYQKEYKQ
jgi:hypothetical protein